jgi:acetyltransferase-like isoleucine patch superfamily enzyme
MHPVILTKLQNYSDEFGNEISYSGNHSTKEVKITFSGGGNKLFIESDATLAKLFIDFKGQNAEIFIGGATSARLAIRLGSNSKITIGRGLSTTDAVYMTAFEASSITLGRDCMFAGGVQIRADDAHPIFDIETSVRINFSKPIMVGDHVWLGEGSVILNGSEIGSGSVVGMRSVVKCKAPNNCVLAGVPARVLRENIAWERPHLSCESLFLPDGRLKDAIKEFWNHSHKGGSM